MPVVAVGRQLQEWYKADMEPECLPAAEWRLEDRLNRGSDPSAVKIKAATLAAKDTVRTWALSQKAPASIGRAQTGKEVPSAITFCTTSRAFGCSLTTSEAGWPRDPGPVRQIRIPGKDIFDILLSSPGLINSAASDARRRTDVDGGSV